MTDDRVAGTDLHVRVGIRDRLVVEDERIALDVRLATIGVVLDPHEAAIAGAATVLGDRLGDDLGGGLRGGVDHLRAGVLMLIGTGVGDRQHLARGLRAGQNDRRVLHRELRADVAVDPLHMALGFDVGPLGDQVEDIVGPVLDGGVGDASRRLHHDLHNRGVQRIRGVGRGRAALDVVHLRTLVGDDQGALELTHVFRVDAEVGLQRHLDFDARRHIDE